VLDYIPEYIVLIKAHISSKLFQYVWSLKKDMDQHDSSGDLLTVLHNV